MITVISYPNNNIYTTYDLESLDSSRMVQNIIVDVSGAGDDEYIELYDGANTVTLFIVDECRYDPIDIFYFNKNGAQHSFTMFKKSTETLTNTSEDYLSDTGQPLNGFHQKKRFNIQGKTKLQTNTGFIDEENNEIIRQILLSEKVWRLKDGVLIPLVVTSSSLEYKTQANDKLINYTIDFEYAFNEINSI